MADPVFVKVDLGTAVLPSPKDDEEMNATHTSVAPEGRDAAFELLRHSFSGPTPNVPVEPEAAVVNLSGSMALPPTVKAEENSKITLAWENLTVEVGGRKLLINVSGEVNDGLIAIMGPSGSGKTTLLNCLACRMDPGMTVTSGEFRINGEPYSTSKLKRFLGYVMQDDVLSPHVTVRETLQYVAQLRLPHLPSKEREQRVELVLKNLTLLHCADRLIGSGLTGISGGERKRVSVALELITDPKMLFLDEPTSNLDSLDALHFVSSLHHLTRATGCVILCTIHQPQYKVFRQFDRLILLRSGIIVYDDALENVEEFCKMLDKPCPPDVNPADHIMACVAPNFNDSFRTETLKHENFMNMYASRHHGVNILRGTNRNANYLRQAAPFYQQVRVCASRNWTILMRRHKDWLLNLLLTVINALLIGAVYFDIGTGVVSKQKRLAALFFTVVNQATFGAISSVTIFPSERPVVLRERATGNYSALPYYLGKVFSEVAWKIPFPIIFSVIVYWMIGYNPGATHFFRFLAAMLLSNIAGMSLAMMISTISRVSEVASLALPLVMEVCRLFAGFFSPPATTAEGFMWIKYLSYLFYGFFAVSHNEYDDLLVQCNASSPAKCDAGKDLTALGMDMMKYSDAMGGLCVYIIVCHILGYLAFRFFKW